MFLMLVASIAMADTITLDNGASIVGDLGLYQHGGDCQISVTHGDLSGAIVVVPCARLSRFERSPAVAQAPVVAPAVAEEAVAAVAPEPILEEELIAAEAPEPPAMAYADAPESGVTEHNPLPPAAVADARSSANPFPPPPDTTPNSFDVGYSAGPRNPLQPVTPDRPAPRALAGLPPDMTPPGAAPQR